MTSRLRASTKVSLNELAARRSISDSSSLRDIDRSQVARPFRHVTCAWSDLMKMSTDCDMVFALAHLRDASAFQPAANIVSEGCAYWRSVHRAVRFVLRNFSCTRKQFEASR